MKWLKQYQQKLVGNSFIRRVSFFALTGECLEAPPKPGVWFGLLFLAFWTRKRFTFIGWFPETIPWKDAEGNYKLEANGCLRTDWYS